MTRIQNDDAGFSEGWRRLKIETGLKIFAHNPLLGTGPGYISDPASFSRDLEIPHNLEFMVSRMGALKKGADSTPVRLLAEGGVLGFFLAYYPILVFWRRARTADGRTRGVLFSASASHWYLRRRLRWAIAILPRCCCRPYFSRLVSPIASGQAPARIIPGHRIIAFR